MRPQQLQQLEASWQLFERALARLNEERQQLRLLLQRAIDSPDAATAAASAAATAAAGQHSWQRQHPSLDSTAATAAGDASQGMAACLLAVASDVPGCFGVQRLCSGCMDLQDYEQLADAVERNLMRGRAIIMAFGEC
jgi:hypothetical protein